MAAAGVRGLPFVRGPFLHMKAVVLLPTYNERENIIKILDILENVKKRISGHTISFLVVDDTSPDGTKDVVFLYQKTHKDVFLILGKKEGLGSALLRGMTYAVEKMHADIIVQMDADLSHDPDKLPLFFKALNDGADFVVGSRYIPGGSIPENWGFHRKLYSIIGNALVRFGLGYIGVHDWTGGYRAYRKKFFDMYKESMKAYSGYVFQIAFLHKAIRGGAKVVEIPFHFTDRLYGHSKIAPLEYIRKIIEYICTSRIHDILHGSFGKFLIVGGIGFILNAVILVIGHDLLKLQASIANMIGALVAIFSNFNFNNLWTFQKNKVTTLKEYIIKLIQFYGTSLLGVVVIQTGTIELCTRIFGDQWYFIYFLIGTTLLLIWNYIMYSKVIWKRK